MPEKDLREISRPLREQYDKGIAAIQRDNLDYAITILAGVLEQDPAFFDCRQALRAAQLKKAGAPGGFLKKVFGTATTSHLLARGQLELRSDPLAALQTAEQAVTADPYSVAGHKLLAEAALAADFPRTAVLSLELVFKHAPDRDIALRLGEALARAGQPARAEAVLSELARTFPADPEIAQTLKNITAKRTLTEGGYAALEGGGGSYRDVLRDKEEALSLEQEKRSVKAEDAAARLLAEYEARLAREPKDLRLLRSLAELYTQQKQFEKALEYYQRIIAAEGISEPSLERAITDTRLRQYDDALGRLDPQGPDYEAQKSRLEGERQAYELERARKLAEQYPSDLHIRFELGEVYYRAGKLTEAIQEFQKAQANPHRRIQALYHLGQCFMQRGIHDLAARALQNAIREKQGFDDEKKELIYALGVVFEKMKKPEEAMEQFKLIYEADIGYKDVAARVDAYYSKS